MSIRRYLAFVLAIAGTFQAGRAAAQVYNLKVVTDASPDYSDMPSLVHSVTSKWSTPQEKCWAMFYWNHIARRQTSPMQLHGLELTDPIRQFNDYGYTMCSTIAGINCGIWHHMGLQSRFWDISLHTVSEVFYDGRWHMYDNSMSALYTLCDGRTLASVEEIGREGACDLSGGERELGHISKYHCLYSTGPRGFLTGADTQRSLEEESRCFNPNALKYRSYYYNWDYGHRYILNIRPGEVYTRHYASLGTNSAYYVPNNGKDPENRYRIRGNGIWDYQPDLNSSGALRFAHSATNLQPSAAGLRLTDPGKPGEVIFKVQSANVITSQRIRAQFSPASGRPGPSISISRNNGLTWMPVWTPENNSSDANATNGCFADTRVVEPVNGAYEILIRVIIPPGSQGRPALLSSLNVETLTMLNTKTQPRLNLGRNTIYIGAGPVTDSIVFWPELQNGKYKEHVVEELNIASTREHPGYQGTIHPAKPNEEAWLVYRLEAPSDLTQVTFGGRFYNRAPRSQIDLAWSTDKGKTWTTCWSLRRTSQPWDVIHYETVPVPKGNRSVLLRYTMQSSEASPAACSIYAVRMEANHTPAEPASVPLQVTFNWSERQPDRSLLKRSHTQTVTRLPHRYSISVGGADHPVMDSLRVNLTSPNQTLREGYSDNNAVTTDKFVPKWLTCGKNLAIGKRYTLSKPSATNWDAGDDGKKLTTGAGGPSYAGGASYRSAALWHENANPTITLDLGSEFLCASFGLNLHGYPWWDALQGEIKDTVEVHTSLDGINYVSKGFLNTDVRWVGLPVNYMWTDDESMTSATFRVVPPTKEKARYVKFQISNKRILACAGIEVLEKYELTPFDLQLALPDEGPPIASLATADDGS